MYLLLNFKASLNGVTHQNKSLVFVAFEIVSHNIQMFSALRVYCLHKECTSFCMFCVFRVRVYDSRVSQPVLVLSGHAAAVTCVEMDDWKVVSGANDGLVAVWDKRTQQKLWDMHNR